MSLSRKSWSALTSLTRQWTMEDEEEVEREKRRRVRSSTSTADPDELSPGHSPKGSLTNEGTPEQISSNDSAAARSSAEQIQLDFLKMLRVRDEKRRKRHVETLRQQKEGEEKVGGSQQVRVEILGDLDAEEDEAEEETIRKEKSPPQTAPTSLNGSGPAYASTHEKDSSLRNKDSSTKPPPIGSHKFVSSMSICFDNSCNHTERINPTTTTSPQSPTLLSALQPLPAQSPFPRGAQSPTPNGQTPDSSNSHPAFVRQSSRTASYRMLRKQEEEIMPLQRSASVRTTSKAFEANADQEQEEGKTSPFQRNSRQRVSSRTIQEKMERLAHAAQKSDMVRSPDVAQRTLFLLDEVSRKRGLFEKDPGATQARPGLLKQDLRHVDIVSKRSLFERRGEVSPKPTTNNKVYK
ncbi:ladinin-1 isoform X2 [Hypomesus transpacificus]|uniref:ladinin-1 isoform X2 n=1 Tax=Hypomesus transpacificus TaxID=137520 RepID=UPI001F07201C|nr:ladinin-1 isoform X2 [Hypomesus transpacificus]